MHSSANNIHFRISGLPSQPFQHLFALSENELAALGVTREFSDDSAPGYPCRVSLAHAAPGEELLLLSWQHQDVNSPYRAAGPIFVRKLAGDVFDKINVVPEPVRVRLLSVRAYDARGMIVEADVVEGNEIEVLIARFFARSDVEYLHIHYARRGCYAARVERA